MSHQGCRRSRTVLLVLVYVDDVLVTGSSLELIAQADLKTRFEMTDSGKLYFCTGHRTGGANRMAA
uniref:Reverse transcriptase Ty1/copia-type domain-containing protein n=1 Tax=Peronospora matthiolae TaxID=2874970 RepID=A0AAV1UDI1_9STRA